MTLFHKLETVLNVFSYYFTFSKFYSLILCFILNQSIVGTQGNKKPGSVLPGRANPSVRVSCQRTKEFIYTFLNDLFNFQIYKGRWRRRRRNDPMGSQSIAQARGSAHSNRGRTQRRDHAHPQSQQPKCATEHCAL